LEAPELHPSSARNLLNLDSFRQLIFDTDEPLAESASVPALELGVVIGFKRGIGMARVLSVDGAIVVKNTFVAIVDQLDLLAVQLIDAVGPIVGRTSVSS
jgi:hypothetical protein